MSQTNNVVVTQVGKEFQQDGEDLRKELEERKPKSPIQPCSHQMFVKLRRYFDQLDAHTGTRQIAPAIQADLCVDLEIWINLLKTSDSLTSLVADLALSSTRGFSIRINNRELYTEWAEERKQTNLSAIERHTHETANQLVSLTGASGDEDYTLSTKEFLLHIMCKPLLNEDIYAFDLQALDPSTPLTATDLLHLCLWRERRRARMPQQSSTASVPAARLELQELSRTDARGISSTTTIIDRDTDSIPFPIEATLLHWVNQPKADLDLRKFAAHLFKQWQWLEDSPARIRKQPDSVLPSLKLMENEYKVASPVDGYNVLSPVDFLAIGSTRIGKTSFFYSIYKSLQPSARESSVLLHRQIQFEPNTLHYVNKIEKTLEQGGNSDTPGQEQLDAKFTYLRNPPANLDLGAKEIVIPLRITDYKGGDAELEDARPNKDLVALLTKTQILWFMLDDRYLKDYTSAPGNDGKLIEPINADRIGAWYRVLLNRFGTKSSAKGSKVPVALVINKADKILGPDVYLATTPEELKLLPDNFSLEELAKSKSNAVDCILDCLRRNPVVNCNREVQKRLWELFNSLRPFLEAVIQKASHFQVFLTSANQELAKKSYDPKMPLKVAEWSMQIMRPAYELKLQQYLTESLEKAYGQLTEVKNQVSVINAHLEKAKALLEEVDLLSKTIDKEKQEPKFMRKMKTVFESDHKAQKETKEKELGNLLDQMAVNLYEAHCRLEQEEHEDGAEDLGMSLAELTLPLDSRPSVANTDQNSSPPKVEGRKQRDRILDSKKNPKQRIDLAGDWRDDLLKSAGERIVALGNLAEPLAALQGRLVETPPGNEVLKLPLPPGVDSDAEMKNYKKELSTALGIKFTNETKYLVLKS
ncbi:hypothetical protein [Pedosphaera parvula]|uniref:Uncharacterized protein n=1 Tax=Pedosphaera parvula (strain Ellin514) TaxID=320771 RepID=B9XAF3_PEDPL|nr:hypothetical protein [Pedosphaera parvula]EEF62988.1 hypothetical protein Cflav_PD5623 [Pedosphaera parvula Ellin514]